MSYLTATNLILALVALLVLLWFLRRPMTGRVRRDAPGEFMQLSNGVVHYQWHGPLDGSVLVMVHGLTTPSFVWRYQIPALTRAGYRVLTFDHFGRGYSDRPYEAHDMAFFVREIDELLEALKVGAGYHLLGYSMGGGIVTHYAALRRDRINKVILVAPVGFLDSEPGWVAQWPVIGDLVTFLLGGWTLRRMARKGGTAEGVDPELIEMQCNETRFAGYGAAVLSSVRNVIHIDQRKEHKVLKERGMPVLAIFGKDDTVIPFECAMRLRETNRDAQIVEIAGAGHALVNTHPAQVNDAILSFLAPPQPQG